MKNLKSLLVLSLTTASLLLAATAARADTFDFTLTSPAFQTGDQSVVAFYATVTNNSGSTVYLNSDNAYVDSPLSVDDSPYDNGFPYTLAPGASYSGLLFNVDTAAGPDTGYSGYFQILGGYGDSSDADVLGTVNFEVATTPEPSSIILLTTGLAGMLASRRRKWFV